MEHAPARDPLIGVIIGSYQIKAKLGAGGMGTVYLAEHPLIGKQVALKVLHAEHAADENVVARFFNEARAVNDIKHPNIVDILDFGVLSGQGRNIVYLLMELIEGTSLATLLRRERSLPLERAFGIAWQIADALSASHAAGIVHRDLKPDNIMLLQRGRQQDFVKVLDFGIAKLGGDQRGSHRTRTGVIMGTPAYMSPEQCEGRSDIDHRTDIYALGVLLYRMLTGQVPFHGEGYRQVLVQHLTRSPAPPSSLRDELSPHVEAVVMKALEKNPDARYASMDELMKALDDPVGYVENHGGPVPPARWSRATLISAGLVIALGVAGGVLLARQRGEQHTASAAAGEPETVARPDDTDGKQQAAAGDDGSGGREIAAGPPAPEMAAPETVAPEIAAPEIAAPEMVAIAIASEPPGAEVFVGSEQRPRGKTPLTIELARSAEAVTLTLRRRGHEDRVEQLIPRQPGQLRWRLTRARARERMPKESERDVSSPGIGEDVTLEPVF